jgi:hypothetical protein
MKTTAFLAAMLLASSIPAHSEPESAAARDARMQWWRDARFGMFVHWGLYSGLAGSWNDKMVADSGGLEWIQNTVGADTYSYAAQAVPKFQPKPGFAKDWARLAKQAGCQYVVFTTKGKTQYLHLFSRPEGGTLTFTGKAAKATLLAGGAALEIKADGDSTLIQLPAQLPDPVATVIRLD